MTFTPDLPTPADLLATDAIDAAHPAVLAFAQAHAIGPTDRERAVSLALAVRDQIRYDPYQIDLSPTGMRASTCLQQGFGWCVPKAVLLTAVCRAAGIPARLGLRGAMWTSRVLHVGALVMLVLAWRSEARLGATFGAAVGLVGALLVLEHVVLARRGKAGLDMAFFTLNGIVSCVLGAAGCVDLLV